MITLYNTQTTTQIKRLLKVILTTESYREVKHQDKQRTAELSKNSILNYF